MTTTFMKVATLTLMSSLLVLPNTQTLAYNNQLKEAKTALENIAKVDPDKELIEMEKASLANDNLENDFNKLTLEQDNLKIEIDKRTGRIALDSENQEVPRIRIPDNQTPIVIEDKLIYTSPLADKVVEPISGGVRQIVHIKNSSAPKFYDFPMELEEGQILTLNEQNGGANVTNQAGEKVMIIGFPWAKDAEGNDLETYYEIVDKNTLRQFIDFNEGTAFPVSADPVLCDGINYNSISYADWHPVDYYDEGFKWSLRLVPTACGKRYSRPTPWSSWEDVVNMTPDSEHWDKKYGTDQYWSMYNQYVCHTDFVPYYNLVMIIPGVDPVAEFIRQNEYDPKKRYHLEPWRKDKGYLGFMVNLCND